MGQQSVRQAARRSALETQLARRRARAERERRLEGLAVDVLVAVGERDAAIQASERRAGQALLVNDGPRGAVIAGGSRMVRWRDHAPGGDADEALGQRSLVPIRESLHIAAWPLVETILNQERVGDRTVRGAARHGPRVDQSGQD